MKKNINGLVIEKCNMTDYAEKDVFQYIEYDPNEGWEELSRRYDKNPELKQTTQYQEFEIDYRIKHLFSNEILVKKLEYHSENIHKL